jgi:DNA invertase Pin-like site-specific DNA recombinase
MGIADLIVTNDKPVKGPTCTVCVELDRLERERPEDAAALLRLLSDRDVRYAALSDALATEGLDLAAGTLSRHARGRCEAKTKLRRA